MIEMPSDTINCWFIKNRIVLEFAPITLRIPISLILPETFNADKAKTPVSDNKAPMIPM